MKVKAGLQPEFADNFLAQRKIENAGQGLPPAVAKRFLEIKDKSERLLVADFLNDLQNNTNCRPNTKKAHFYNLLYLIQKTGKPFKEMTKDDIQTYLQTLRRSSTADPTEKWISTYNQRLTSYFLFFKWLYFGDVEPSKRDKPPVVDGLQYYKKREVTGVKAQDLWTIEEDKVFLKYCEDPRVSLYHTMSDDTSARPHELLALRIGDVKIKNVNGKVYGEVEVGRGGKTKSRTVPLIISIPWFKNWLTRHPDGSNPSAFIFISQHPSAKYRNRPLNASSLHRLYRKLKREFFPRLLESPDVLPEDKQIMKTILAKPWNPYLRRHSSLTEKAKLVPEYSLRLHAGWSKSSKMIQIYTHELGGESSKAFLAAYGIIPKKDSELKMDALQPKSCPVCNEPNKQDARFCANVKCGTPLSFDGYVEVKEKEQEKDKKLDFMHVELDSAVRLVRGLAGVVAAKTEAEKAEALMKLAKDGLLPTAKID